MPHREWKQGIVTVLEDKTGNQKGSSWLLTIEMQHRRALTKRYGGRRGEKGGQKGSYQKNSRLEEYQFERNWQDLWKYMVSPYLGKLWRPEGILIATEDSILFSLLGFFTVV